MADESTTPPSNTPVKKTVTRKKATATQAATKKTVARKAPVRKKAAAAPAPAPASTAVKKTTTRKAAPRRAAAEPKHTPVAEAVHQVISPEHRQEMISTMAYFRAEQRGFEPGNEIHDWLESERIVDEMLDKGV